jgi:hypothetical protein
MQNKRRRHRDARVVPAARSPIPLGSLAPPLYVHYASTSTHPTTQQRRRSMLAAQPMQACSVNFIPYYSMAVLVQGCYPCPHPSGRKDLKTSTKTLCNMLQHHPPKPFITL